jgi:addiction module HigA family antidote
MILDHNSVGANYVPSFKIKNNLFDYYEEFVRKNMLYANRSLEGSLMRFKKFRGKEFISATKISENVCKRYRDYLVKNFNGETPQGYFMRFKRVMKNAAKEGYNRTSPAEDIAAKKGANQKKKEILDEEEYFKLMNTPCLNYEIKKAYLEALNLTFKRFAIYVDTTDGNLKKYVSGVRKFNTDLALKFGHFFHTSPDLWLNVQIKNELASLKKEKNSLTNIGSMITKKFWLIHN